MNKLLKELKIDMVGIHYESIVFGSTANNQKYFITVDNLKKMLLTDDTNFQVVPKRKRTWIEPVKIE